MQEERRKGKKEWKQGGRRKKRERMDGYRKSAAMLKYYVCSG